MPIDWSILRSNGPVDVAGNFAAGYKTGRAIVDDIHERNALAQYAAHPGDPQARAALYRVNPELAARLEETDMRREDYQREGEARSALAGFLTGPDGIPQPRGLTGTVPNALTGEVPSEPAPPSASDMTAAAPQPAQAGDNGDIVVTANKPQPQGHPTADGLIRQPAMSDSWRRYVEADPEGSMKTLLTRAQLGKEQALALAGQMDFMGRLAAGVTDQASYDQAKATAQAQGFDTSHLPDQYDPRAVQTMQAQAMSAKDYLQQQHDFTDDEIDNAEVERHHKADEGLTARGQDIRSSDTKRGQDISSTDRQRGQDKSSTDRQRGQDMRGSGGGGGAPSPSRTAVIVNPKTGQRMKLVDGKWVPA